MKIAIVGANNFLSQALLKELRADHDILQVYHKNTDKLDVLFEQMQIDVFLEEKPFIDCIYYIASYISFQENYNEIEQIYLTNIALLKKVSEIFNTAKIIHTSSVSVYKQTEKVINEESEIDCNNSYGVSKLWAELIVKQHAGGGVNIRISSMFGEGMNRNTFLPKIIDAAINKSQVCLFGNGERKQNYIYVKDVALILHKALVKKTEIPILAVGVISYSNNQIVEIIKETLPNITIHHAGIDNSPSFVYDNTETQKRLDITISDNFKEQIKNIILWIREPY